MEIVDPSERAKHRHAWLEWLGLQDPPAEADSWVAVARGFRLDMPGGTSRLATELVDTLGKAGVEARPRRYEFYDNLPGVPLPRDGMVTCAAVLVHNRDLGRAVEIAYGVKDELARESQEPLSGGLSDEELARQALEAGPPPPD